MIDDPRLKQDPLGFLRLAEPPSSDELQAYYREKYFQTEQGNYRRDYPEEERRFLNLKIEQKAHRVAQLRGDDPGRLLDVGCGEGFALAWHAARGWSVEGLDHSTAGIEAMHPELRNEVDAGDVFALLEARIAAHEIYDVVWLSNVLEHVLDPIGLLVSLERVVRPGGVLVATVPNDGSAFQEALLERGDIAERFWIAIPDHVSYFTHDSLVRAAESSGWDCCDVLADFPIDQFLLHPGSNYVRDRGNGEGAHRGRVNLELLLGEQPHERVNAYYAAMARVGLGRQLTAFLRHGDAP